MLRVLVGVHRAAEDHHRVPAARLARRAIPVRDDPAVELVASLDDDLLEEPATTGLRRVVDDREHAHRPIVGARLAYALPALEQA